MILSNNRPDIDSTSTGQSTSRSRIGQRHSMRRGSSKKASIQQPKRGASPSFPSSRKAIAVAYDGGSDQATKVREELARAGYDANRVGASFSDMRNDYKNLGVLYLDTHGATFNRIRGRSGALASDSSRYALQTSTKANLTPAWIKSYEQELLNDEIVLSSWCVLGKNCAEDVDSVSASGTDIKVAVTEKFISKHWTFADGGMAFIHACRIAGGSERDYPGAQAIREAVLQDAGAESLVATKGDTNAGVLEEGIVSAFEMLLGTARTEFGRPWSLQSVKKGLSSMGLIKYKWSTGGFDFTPVTTELRFFGNGATRLAPSTRRLKIVDDAAKSVGTLRIKGSFPSTQGKVLLGSNKLSVQSWGQNKIVAEVPFVGSASSGPVRVDAQEGTRGNRVSLTKWSGSLEGVVREKGDHKGISTGEIVFRGDIHPTRESPTAKPTLPKEIEAYVSPGSKMSFQGSGSYVNDNGVTVKWTGSYDYDIAAKTQIDKGYGTGPLSLDGKKASRGLVADGKAKSTDPFGVPPKFFGGKVTMRPRDGTGKMCLRLSSEVEAVSDAGGGTSTKLNFPVSLYIGANNSSVGVTGADPPLGCFKLTFQDIPANPSSAGRRRGLDNSSSGGNLSMILEWDGLQATGQPLPRTE